MVHVHVIVGVPGQTLITTQVYFEDQPKDSFLKDSLIKKPVTAANGTKIVQSARDEVLRIFSSITAFRRQARIRVLHLFKESIEHGVKVRVLIPADYQQITQIISEVNLVLPELFIRCVDKSLQNTIGILVIDRKESLIIETKDDTKDNSYEAAGLGAYSDSKPIALSYASTHSFMFMIFTLYFFRNDIKFC